MVRAKSEPSRIALVLSVGLAAALSSVPVAASEVKTGLISVRTGVSFRMVDGTLEYQLYGIQTCAASQVAHLNGVAWPCGAVATGWLTQLTLSYQIQCLEEGRARDQYAIVLARCFLPTGEDIAKLALEEGLAWTLHEDGQPIVREYQTVEQDARSQKRGLWSSNFMLGNQLYRP